MKRWARALRWVTAGWCVAIGLGLIGQAVLWGVPLSRDEAARRLLWLLPALAVLAFLAALGKIACRDEDDARPFRNAPPKSAAKPVRPWVRLALYALGAVLVGLGVWNGGARDVLIKAIQICSECIGLG